MSRRAWVYIASILLLAAVLAALSAVHFSPSLGQWHTFLVFTILATLARLNKSLFESKQQGGNGTTSYSPMLVFLFAGVLTLAPFLFVLLVIVPHLVEWGKERWRKTGNLPAWYIQPFNIATHVIVGLAAHALYTLLGEQLVLLAVPSPVFAMTAAAGLYVVLNHLVVGQALVVARGLSWRATKIMTVGSILPDLVMTSLGYVLAMLWVLDPWMILAVLAPLGLIHRALMVPQLKQEAETDGKTGLANARYFAAQFAAELEQAKRLNRPLALILGDLDFLREINNTYGHLAGDAVLVGIGDIIRKTVRDDDIAARFGGEEFAIVLPNICPDDAYLLAERLRKAIAAASFPVATSPAPIRATMSLGVACYPADAATTADLIHEADVAVYQGKFLGRNRVVAAANVPHATKLEHMPSKERPDSQTPSSPTSSSSGPPPISSDRVRSTVVAAATSAKSSPTPTMQSVAVPPLVGSAAGSSSAPAHLPFFVAVTIIVGVAATIGGVLLTERLDLVLVLCLTMLAVLVEYFQVNAYGPNTTSVSVAVAFAGALIGGMPAVAAISAAIALTHYIRRRPPLYKAAFNWSTHVLAGTVPVVIVTMLQIPVGLHTLLPLAAPVGVAVLAYYLVDTGLIAAAIGCATRQALFPLWRDQFGWLAWHYGVLCVLGLFFAATYATLGPAAFVVFALPIGMMRFAQKQYIDRTERGMRELQRMNGELAAANTAIQQLNDGLFLTVAKLFDARDPYVSGHAAQVARYAVAIAQELGLPPAEVEHVRQAGYLHDVGKMAIPETILHKPSKLTDEEFSIMKTHAVLGAEFLETSQGLRFHAPFVRHHHERWDGRGYPDGLAGEAIPLIARILNVCDSVEAMAADRPYHRGMSVPEIVAEVQRCSGTQFDPTIAAIFVRLVEQHGAAFVINSAQEVERRQADVPGAPSQRDLYLRTVSVLPANAR